MNSKCLSLSAGAIIVTAVLLISTPARIFADGLYGDDASYVAHAFTIAFDGDLDYSNEYIDWAVNGPHGVRPAHPVGVGIAAAPVLLLFSLWDRAEAHAVVGDRAAFPGARSMLGFWVASAAALLGGILALLKSLEWTVGRVAHRTAAIAVMGSGIPFYALNRFTMSHAYEFLFIALMMLSSVALVLNAEHRARSWFVLGLSMAMTILIRPGNLPYLLVPISTILLVRLTGAGLLRPSRKDAFRAVIAFAVTWVPALALQRHLYGVPLPLSYRTIAGGYWTGPDGIVETGIAARSNLSLQSLALVIFGGEFGVAWSSTVILAGSLAATTLAFRTTAGHLGVRASFLLVTAAMLTVGLASVLAAGHTGIDYGIRFLYPLVPISTFSLGVFIQRLPPLEKVVLAWVLTASACVGVVSTAFYQSAGTPDRLLTHSVQENIFGQTVSSARFYGRDLVGQVYAPEAWLRVFAIRSPGFFLSSVVDPDLAVRIGASLGMPEARIAEGVRWTDEADRADRLVIGLILSGLIFGLLRASREHRSVSQVRNDRGSL